MPKNQLPPRPPMPGRERRMKHPHQPKAVEQRATHWGGVADWYDRLVGDEGSDYHQHVVIPGVIRLLDLDKDKNLGVGEHLHVLDLACGQGVLSRRLAQTGCRMVGVDASQELIRAAQRRNQEDELPIDYVVADATQLLDDQNRPIAGLRPEGYDAITIVLAIQNITPLSPVWNACHKLLKPQGRLIVVMMHPCFRVPRQSDWHWNHVNKTQSRVVSQYLSSSKIEIQTHPGLAAHGKDNSVTLTFHRPLQAYINTMGGAGLYIDHIEEWTSHKTDQVGPKKEAIDRARKEIPMFMALRARKI